jgi:hypothetical protein
VAADAGICESPAKGPMGIIEINSENIFYKIRQMIEIF